MTAPEARSQPGTEQGGRTRLVMMPAQTGGWLGPKVAVVSLNQEYAQFVLQAFPARHLPSATFRSSVSERTMELRLNETAVVEESRIAGIRMVLLTLRMMEHWREAAGDYNSAMVLLAIVAVSSEKLTRAELPNDQRALRDVVDDDALTRCNISSIAAATGFNRETTRRYVNRLVNDGVLVRTEHGSVRFVQGFIQRTATAQLLGLQLEAFARTANELLRLDVLRVQS